MPTLPYFTSGYSQIEIDYANWCRKQDAAALAEKIAKQERDFDPNWSQNHTTKGPYW